RGADGHSHRVGDLLFGEAQQVAEGDRLALTLREFLDDQPRLDLALRPSQRRRRGGFLLAALEHAAPAAPADQVHADALGPGLGARHLLDPRPPLERAHQRLVGGVTADVPIAGDDAQRRDENRVESRVPSLERHPWSKVTSTRFPLLVTTPDVDIL